MFECVHCSHHAGALVAIILQVNPDDIPAGFVMLGGPTYHELTFYGSTNDADESGLKSGGTIYVSFMIEGVWTTQTELFNGRINKGQNVSRTINYLNLGPEQVKLIAR